MFVPENDLERSLALATADPSRRPVFYRDFGQATVYFVLHGPPPAEPGPFTLTLATVPDPARHVQYGFRLTGACVWITDVGQYGTIVIGPHQPVPTETTSWGQVKGLYR